MHPIHTVKMFKRASGHRSRALPGHCSKRWPLLHQILLNHSTHAINESKYEMILDVKCKDLQDKREQSLCLIPLYVEYRITLGILS